MGTDENESVDPATRVLLRGITSIMLLFDFVTSIIGLVAFMGASIECCGETVQYYENVKKIILCLSLGYMALIIIEFYPIVFKRLLWLATFNPLVGSLLIAVMIIQSSRWEAQVGLSFVVLGVLLQWVAVKVGEEECGCFMSSRICITLLPTLLVVLILVNYLAQDGFCLELDEGDTQSEEGGFSIGVSRGDPGDSHSCFVCGGDGLPFVLEAFRDACLISRGGDVGSDLFGENGDYCGNLTGRFCFFAG